MTSKKTTVWSISAALAVAVPVAVAVAGEPALEGGAAPSGRAGIGHAHGLHHDCAHPTPLHLAALREDMGAIARLIKAGAGVGAVDALGETPLHSAVRRFRLLASAALIESGAPLEARNRDGQTPLALLASMGPSLTPEVDAAKTRLAELLIERGADVNAIDDAGTSALGYAEWREHTALSLLLSGRGALPGPNDPEVDRVGVDRAPPAGYPTHAQLGAALLQVETNHPAIAQRVSLGLSNQNREIWAIRITDNLGLEEDEPEVGYISTMHGDEITGLDMCMRLIDWLTDNYGSVQRATDMVDEMDIWIVPTMNPDGYELNQRGNVNGVDLNRDFPDWWIDPINTPAGREVETGVIMNWKSGESFTLTANFHGGALVANYPLDGNPAGASVYSASPDDDLFIDISIDFTEDNAPMYNSPTFPMGITNGADWYHINGGMQDWNYFWLGCNEILVEMSNVKSPPYSQMPTFWADNQEGMISYLERAWDGVRGIVTDSTTGLPVFATITVTGRDHDVFTDPDVGDYHRMLLDGTYELTFVADGYETLVAPNVVVSPGARSVTRLDVQMDPTGAVAPAEVLFPNGGEQLPAGVEQVVQWDGTATASYQLQLTNNYNDSAFELDGFESGVIGPAYTTGGSADWTTTGSPVFSGSFAAASGNVADGQTSWLERTVTGPGSVNFWYRVSSEPGFDFFNFLIDGQSVVSASGTTGGWAEALENLSAGPHTLRWEFVKDGSLSSGSDTAWIDDLKIISNNTVWADLVADTGTGVTSYAWTPTVETSAAKVRVRKVLPGGVFGPWDESDAVFVVAPPAPCVGDIDGDLDTDVFDFGVFAANFGQSVPVGTGGDLDGDGDVDVFDFGIFSGDFGCTP